MAMRKIAQTLLFGMLLSPLVIPSAISAGPPAASGPIDIRANEQEFAENQVIAKGNVKVTYKDSIIYAPLATLFRDPAGNPQRAVFTGHPRLTQGDNKIDADTLTFEMANSKIIAAGHAHSEVMAGGGEEKPKAEGATFAGGESSKTGFSDELATLPKSGGSKPQKAEKIITDSDRQEYDRDTGKFEAIGSVRVQHGEILVKADKLQLIYGLDNKPEAAVFTGNVNAMQGKNSTTADNMTYSLATKRLQATGHVKSTVIQEKKDMPKGKTNTIGLKDPVGIPSAAAATTNSGASDSAKEDVVIITSDTQDYSRETGRMSANGNVRVFYQNVVGAGPTAILLRNQQGKAERIVFTGRSQISQPGRRWIADRIEMTIEDKKVIATGNTKALILQMPKSQPKPPEMQLAGRSNSISATKVDVPR